MSKTFLERKNPNGPYVFISYSHADNVAVSKLLTALNDNGADFWYDIKLRGGQNWFDKVKEVTSSKNCVGIIYVLSPEFVFSNACFKEFLLLDELKKTHENFREYYILADETKPDNFNEFMRSVRRRLLDQCLDNEDEIFARTNEYKKRFDQDIIYRMTAMDSIVEDKFVRTVFRDVFSAWGCASEENGKMDTLVEDGLIDSDYRIKTKSYMLTDVVNRSEAEWLAFSYKGNTVSAILIADELYAATCRSLAQNAMVEANKLINISDKTDADEKLQREKHFLFEPEFLECLNKDEDGNIARYLCAAEHDRSYMQLKEALMRVPISEAADDGYFFVTDNQDNILFADRASNDVYRHIHVDAYASIFPVIDIDLNKYKEYLTKKGLL